MKKKHSCANSVFCLIRVCIIQFALSFVLPGMSFAQTPGVTSVNALNISGTVRDEDSSKVIEGVSVTVKGIERGTITNSKGGFSIRVPNKNSILVFSSVNYGSQEVQVGNRGNLDVVLRPKANSLNDVVVIGYGRARKADLIGAVSSVKGSELITQTSPSVAQMLQGRAAGLVINNTSAQPGGGFSFNIRGLTSTGIGNEPLVIVDGYPISNSNTDLVANPRYNTGFKNTSLSSINPQDIESIEVLKDASATAIYGARAGHGVILITTKRGRSGKTVVEYSANATTQNVMRKPEMLVLLENRQLLMHRRLQLLMFQFPV